MKNILLLTFFVLSFCIFAAAQTKNSDPKQVVEDFYNKIWLNPESSSEYYIQDKSGNIKEYISVNLHKKLLKLYQSADGDYFLNWSGDYTPGSIKIVEITDAVKTGNKASLTATFNIPNTKPKPGEGNYFAQTMKISLIKEKSGWKINDVVEWNSPAK